MGANKFSIIFLLLAILSQSWAENVQGTPCACMEEEKPVGCGNIDCCALQAEGATKSGVYVIHPYVNNRTKAVKVYCDMETAGGGWTLFQRREEVRGPFEAFNRDIKSYSAGFGQLKYSHWLGLKHIEALTANRDQAVRFDLTNWAGEKKYAQYGYFVVNPESTKYLMEITADYVGNAGDAFALQPLNGMKFTTFDQDEDLRVDNCASNWHLGVYYSGGFWYNSCGRVYLNTNYGRNGTEDGLHWGGFSHNLMRSEMKLRNKDFPNGCAPGPKVST